MESRITPFLMFTGQAEEAMNLYASVFPDAEIEQIQRYGEGEDGAEGTVMRAVFRLQNQRFVCIDSPPVHAFGFTPSISMFVECPSAEEVDRICARLSDGGSVMMPLGEYPFSNRFAWISDHFGVSWQLSLALD
ncbi:MAG: VOC family protein [Nitrolancea sp.]